MFKYGLWSTSLLFQGFPDWSHLNTSSFQWSLLHKYLWQGFLFSIPNGEDLTTVIKSKAWLKVEIYLLRYCCIFAPETDTTWWRHNHFNKLGSALCNTTDMDLKPDKVPFLRLRLELIALFPLSTVLLKHFGGSLLLTIYKKNPLEQVQETIN